MDTLSYKTVSLKAGDIQKEWYVIDATDMVLGRLASRVALILRGKNKPSFTPNMDCGDNVIIVNADNHYQGSEHPHQAQNPKTIKLNEI